MGVMDKFLNAMKLNPDEEDYDDYDDYDEPEEEVVVEKAPRNSSRRNYEETEEYEEKPKKAPAKVTQMRPPRKSVGTGMEVCGIKPTSVDDASTVTDTLLSNRTVVLNLEGIDMVVAQRIIDFTYGSTYAIKGSFQKISQYIFIITPASVDVSGDFQELLSGSFDTPLRNK